MKPAWAVGGHRQAKKATIKKACRLPASAARCPSRTVTPCRMVCSFDQKKIEMRQGARRLARWKCLPLCSGKWSSSWRDDGCVQMRMSGEKLPDQNMHSGFYTRRTLLSAENTPTKLDMLPPKLAGCVLYRYAVRAAQCPDLAQRDKMGRLWMCPTKAGEARQKQPQSKFNADSIILATQFRSCCVQKVRSLGE